jgi:uncharacterized repeat protein (TIGR01451 family)
MRNTALNQGSAHGICLARAAIAALALFAGSAAIAAEQGCIELKSSAEVEEQYKNEQGQNATRLVPAGKVVPGDEVVWTITAKNVCNKPADNVVVANPVPEHMNYVADSAMGTGTDIDYSVDGREFKPAAALTVRNADGSSRAARQDEVRAIRWTYKASFAPGASGFVRYRAVVK